MSDGDEGAQGGDGTEGFVRRVEETLEMVRSSAAEDDLGPALSLLDDLEDVLDEAEDLLSTMDLSELVRDIEWEDVPDAVELDDVGEAIEESDLSEAVSLRGLLDAVDLSEVWDDVDARELWREKREFDDEVDDVVGDGESDASGSSSDVGAASMSEELPGLDLDPETIQAGVQSELSGAVDELREKLIDAHDRLELLREVNVERFESERTGSSSRNPTAGFSTKPRKGVGSGATGRFSTVPEETRYSTAPNRKRIYGRRFATRGGDRDD